VAVETGFNSDVSVHPNPDEIDRYARVSPQLGDTYVRAPRWGTYLSPRHLDAVGGRAKVIAEVQPASVREIGQLTYFQLSERVEDALSSATEAKRAKFEALVAPLLPPGDHSPHRTRSLALVNESFPGFLDEDSEAGNDSQSQALNFTAHLKSHSRGRGSIPCTPPGTERFSQSCEAFPFSVLEQSFPVSI